MDRQIDTSFSPLTFTQFGRGWERVTARDILFDGYTNCFEVL